MNVGMLWFDNDPKADLTNKIERAATYYRGKYGRSPNICFVHPSMTDGAANHGKEASGPLRAGGVEVRTTRSVLPNHLWIGINGASS